MEVIYLLQRLIERCQSNQRDLRMIFLLISKKTYHKVSREVKAL